MTGKRALVVGASRGIGAACAALLAGCGAHVVLAARDVVSMERQGAEIVARGGRADVISLDLLDPASVQDGVAAAVEKLGGLDIAINNAGDNSARDKLADLALDCFDRICGVNLRGIFIAMQQQIRVMEKAGQGGSIVNTSSAASAKAMQGMAAYVASKHGLVGLTRVAALEYAASGIRVNAVAPGAVMTEMLRAGTLSEAGEERLLAAIPLRRIGTAEDLARAVVWLASDEASYITGVNLPVDGGYLL